MTRLTARFVLKLRFYLLPLPIKSDYGKKRQKTADHGVKKTIKGTLTVYLS